MKHEGHTQNNDSEKPHCLIESLPGIGERRVYEGVLQSFVPHTHDYYVFGLVKAGTRKLMYNNQEFLLEPGNVVVFNPGDYHGCEGINTQRFAYDSITMQNHLFDNQKLIGPKVTDEEVIATFRQILAMIDTQRQSPCEDAPNASCLIESLLSLGNLLMCENTSSIRTSANETAARNVHAHFCNHLSSPLSLQLCAEMVGLSPYALMRAYTATFGTTPMKHLASLRVERARELLSQGLEPSAVAEQCGFADQAHLTREFKKRLGITPGAYRHMTSKAKRSA